MRMSFLTGWTILVIATRFDRTETCNSPYYTPTKCVDKIDRYECLCGQGQLWDGYSCVADAVNSRLVFNASRFPSYIKLDSKTFPRLSEVTISFWLRIWLKVDPTEHTVLYYRTDDADSVLLVSLTPNLRLHVEVLNRIYDVSVPLAIDQWHHVTIAHHLSRRDEIKIMLNSSLVLVLISSKRQHADRRDQFTVIDSGGELFVGQAVHPTNLTGTSITGDLEFDMQRAFHGEITFLNIWQKMLADNELHQLAIDCHVQRQECGDAVTWMDFVNDIKGETQIHWPSGIYTLFNNCPSEQWLQESCDGYCRKIEGPHCKNDSQLSIIWQKVMAGETVIKHCPGLVKNGSVYRTCQRIEQIARWTNVEYGECAHPLISAIDVELDTSVKNEEEIIALRDKCAFLAETTSSNLTTTQLYSSIDLILLIEQIERLTNILTSHFDSLMQWYSSSDESFYPGDINATLYIHRYLTKAISNLIDERYQPVWIETNPLGNDFLRLLSCLQRSTIIIAQILTDDCDLYPGCSFHIYTENINQTVAIVHRQQLNTFSSDNEQTLTRVTFSHAKAHANGNTSKATWVSNEKHEGSSRYAVSISSLRTGHLFIPNLRLGRVSKFDNINSHVISIDVKLRKPLQRSNHLSTLIPTNNVSIVLTLGYLKYDNISGNRCVYLDAMNAFTSGQYKSTLFRQWHWHSLSSICNTSQVFVSDRVTCSCRISNGTFAVTSDLFDPNWRPPEVRLRPLNIFSYIGSCIHISFSLSTLFMLNYLRTRSSAAYIHKHYSFVLCCAQTILILAFHGIPHHHAFLCRAVACTSHFFILSSYCWLMNEAFNLYIQITYSTHPAVAGASAALSDAASKYRFLGMGYVLPFCIVSLLTSIKKSMYFMPVAKRLCFIDLDDWFKTYFIPIAGIIFITIMVMIFSAKQQHESSYTKNEKANEVIVTYTGGIWSQLFLITVSWSLAILPYFYDETILRLLHGFFNGLQGSFLFLSFFLFNDEIRRHYRDRRRQLRRIQLMEVPYRNSTDGSEGQSSSILQPAVTSQTRAGTANSSGPSSPVKMASVASAVTTLINRTRQQSSRQSVYDDMKWALRRRSSNDPSRPMNIFANEDATSEDDKDYRVTAV